MFLLRHGQSFFNLHYSLNRKDPGIEDPHLTPLGVEQAQEAAAELAAEKITRIIISPYTRTLQTAEPVLAIHKVPVEIMPDVRERYAFVCDVGTHPDLLAANFPHHKFDHLEGRWWPETTETAEATIERANRFRNHIAAQNDHETTLLVSHWAFILALTGISVGNGEILSYDPTTPAPATIRWHP